MSYEMNSNVRMTLSNFVLSSKELTFYQNYYHGRCHDVTRQQPRAKYGVVTRIYAMMLRQLIISISYNLCHSVGYRVSFNITNRRHA